MIQPKKKLCSGCDSMQYLWKSNPPLCKNCAGKRLADISNKVRANGIKGKPTPQKPIKSKPKPRIDGKPMHTAIYMAAFGYGDQDFIASELSGAPSNDTHHIDCRGAGGTISEDRIENLMGLTREEHVEYGDKKQHMVMLYTKHMEFLERSGVKFDRSWILAQIDKYSDLD